MYVFKSYQNSVSELLVQFLNMSVNEDNWTWKHLHGHESQFFTLALPE